VGNDPVEIALALAIRFEGIYLSPYLDPVGVPTQGIGCTVHLDGRRVLLTDPAITKEEAINWARELIKRLYGPNTLALCPALDTPQRLASICDFVFNLGASRLRSSTLRKLINAGRWENVPAELMKWTHARGRVLPGLKARRAAEAVLISQR
jgi:lysozyme